MSNHTETTQPAPSTPRRRRTIAAIAVAAAVLGSFAALTGDGADTSDSTEIALPGSTWS